LAIQFAASFDCPERRAVVSKKSARSREAVSTPASYAESPIVRW